VFFTGRSPTAPETFTAKMQRKIDSVLGKLTYLDGPGRTGAMC
jgi:hypothetical protein